MPALDFPRQSGVHYGLVTYFKVPGGFSLQLYQPKYAKKRARKARK